MATGRTSTAIPCSSKQLEFVPLLLSVCNSLLSARARRSDLHPVPVSGEAGRPLPPHHEQQAQMTNAKVSDCYFAGGGGAYLRTCSTRCTTSIGSSRCTI